MKIKQPTTTSLVLEALRSMPNEFFTVAMLRAITERHQNDINATLRHLRAHGA